MRLEQRIHRMGCNRVNPMGTIQRSTTRPWKVVGACMGTIPSRASGDVTSTSGARSGEDTKTAAGGVEFWPSSRARPLNLLLHVQQKVEGG